VEPIIVFARIGWMNYYRGSITDLVSEGHCGSLASNETSKDKNKRR
jgi:hypothetical protein